MDPRGARLRLVFAVVCGLIGWFATPSDFSTATRALIAWVAVACALLVVAFIIIVRADADETRRRAASQDPGHTAVWIVVLIGSTISLFAAAAVVRQVKNLPAFEGQLMMSLSIATVILGWFLTHTAFTLRYAHLFYRSGRKDEGGIEFQQSDKPDDLDFAYFAFTIGMCFQVSDTAITDRGVRRTVLFHAILAFAYNTGILALVLNIVVGQLA